MTLQLPDLAPLPLPPAPAGHRWRVDPHLCGRAYGQGLQRGGELYADLPRGAAIWRVLLGSPVTEQDLSGEGLLLLASDGRSYSPGKARWLVDEMMGRIPGHRSWLATWTRYSGIWARRFALGVEAGWLREVGESERDEDTDTCYRAAQRIVLRSALGPPLTDGGQALAWLCSGEAERQ